MIKKIKKIIGYYLNKEKKQYFDFKIASVSLKGLKGTHRIKVDQDDAWFFALSKNAENILDLGCNIGYMSLLAAIQKNNKSITLVDPNPEALAKAAQNIIINGFAEKAKFFSAFISNIDKEKVKFYTVGSGEAGSMYSSHAETANALNSYYYVETLTIDSLIDKLNFTPDLIKVDVEGAESLALMGATKTASKAVSKFFIEMHSLPEMPMKKNGDMILDWCKNNHYKAFYLKEGKQIFDSSAIESRGKCHLLLIPEKEDYPLYLKNIQQGDKLPNSID